MICASQKMDKKVLLFERSEFQHFPIFRDAQIMLKRSASTRRASLRSPFLDYLFWRSKKGNWPPGHTRPQVVALSKKVNTKINKSTTRFDLSQAAQAEKEQE